MKLSDLQFDYPEELIATKPLRPSRVLWVSQDEAHELSMVELMKQFSVGDVLVINNTKVLRRRVFAEDLEILFLASDDQKVWQVLFPSRKFKVGDRIPLPLGATMTLLEKGRPQKVATDQILDESYFQKVGELPLPPYIQKMRENRHAQSQDESWYQTAWAKEPGSFAAPTASLHFCEADLKQLSDQGVKVVELTLHVGLGTFLPVTVQDLIDHEMHAEFVVISESTWQAVQKAKANHKKVWSLGTTSTRALESAAQGLLGAGLDGGYSGFTKLLIQEGFQFRIVDRLMTNFHQPESTLLALVAGFAGLATVKDAYRYAVERRFRLFSYGDLSVWEPGANQIKSRDSGGK